MVDDTSKGFLLPSKANRTLAQALDCFQGDFAAPRLGAQDNHNNIDGQIQGQSITNTNKGRPKSCTQVFTLINSPPLHSWLFLANHILYEPISAILPIIYYLHWTNYELTRRFTKIKALEFGLNELIRLCLNTSKVLQGFTSNRTEIHWSRKVCEK